MGVYVSCVFPDCGGYFLMFTRLFKMGSFVNYVNCSGDNLGYLAVNLISSRLTNTAGLGQKLKLVQKAQSQICSSPYELRSDGQGSLRYGGWRYLFTFTESCAKKLYGLCL